jgi:hypothetical protein
MPRIERLNRLIARMDRAGRAEPEPRTLEDWVNAVLQNDEIATDEELIDFFMSEGPMGREEAEDAVSQRGEALRDRHYRVEMSGGKVMAKRITDKQREELWDFLNTFTKEELVNNLLATIADSEQSTEEWLAIMEKE